MSTRLLHSLGLCLATGLAFAAAGCDPFTNLDIETTTDAPPADHLAFEAMRVTEGRAIGFMATPMEGNDQMDDDTTVELVTKDPGIVGIGPTLDKWSFVVFGAAPGKTSIRVTINDTDETEIPVTVEAP